MDYLSKETYGIPPQRGLLFVPDIGGEEIFTEKDLWWAIPVFVFGVGFVAFATLFYWNFPAQMIWLIPGILLAFLLH